MKFKKSDYGRWVLDAILIACIWLGYKWALYIGLTLCIMSSEIASFYLNKMAKLLGGDHK